ncbi:cytochrome b/b6 domain-containing protein [Sphingomonas kyeonggiensis]|uniref:Thiosulfate reductase cytochrome b subunit n=1 Tax=Sphingomonas kyeonggiensis TaxID=1268553 RepID=A0A7W6NYX9_9SPHN|nr:cytochrome b/b6 domain-containing protein [Sphingomonas kyeonggiensis]MBB4100236.1 thiosulfate reductase cytochrome b subunit [Sphingomonas kyeonggiensis]
MQVYRHRLITRIWHWINALAVLVMIPSGLMIFNAHPRLYWGNYGANFDQAWLKLPQWPGWLTLPSTYDLAGARHWHLFFALVLAFSLLVYLLWSLANRHLQRDLRIRRAELNAAHVVGDLEAHWQMRFHDPADPRAYNLFQKLSYALVLFVLLPLLILTGLALAPAMWPWIADMFGGRQSARSLHFIAMALTSGFVVVHLTLVILAGPINEVRSMITGWWKLPEGEPAE